MRKKLNNLTIDVPTVLKEGKGKLIALCPIEIPEGRAVFFALGIINENSGEELKMTIIEHDGTPWHAGDQVIFNEKKEKDNLALPVAKSPFSTLPKGLFFLHEGQLWYKHEDKRAFLTEYLLGREIDPYKTVYAIHPAHIVIDNKRLFRTT